jgi:predicted neutral ceramidase superfamily lipid hydrolase
LDAATLDGLLGTLHTSKLLLNCNLRMPMTQEVQLPREILTQIRNQLILATVLLVIFAPFLVGLTNAITQPQPASNLIFGVCMSLFVAILFTASGWYWILFAIHVRSAHTQERGILVSRFFAPSILVLSIKGFKRKAHASPSFNSQGYQHGTLFLNGKQSFYIPANFPEALQIVNGLS